MGLLTIFAQSVGVSKIDLSTGGFTFRIRNLSGIMVDQERDSRGTFNTQYKEKSFLQVLNGSEIPLTTIEVAEKVGCSRRRAHTRLQELEREGKIYSNLAGNEREWSSGPSSKFEERTLADYAAANLSEIPESNAEAMVIAIQKPHSRDILSGRKNIEFRRGPISEDKCPDIAFIYEPSPTQAIVGVFEISSVERESVEELIEVGAAETPSSQEDLEEYFSGLTEGTAIHIGEVRRVYPPVPLSEGNTGEWRFNPPQSFYYVDPEEFLHNFPQKKEKRPSGESQHSGLSSNTS